jgi:hypothetical protein
MDILESDARSFIVKVWIEDRAGETGQGLWHGHITEVTSGQRRYLKNLDEIRDFIAPRLEEMGGNPGTSWRIRRWLKRAAGRG